MRPNPYKAWLITGISAYCYHTFSLAQSSTAIQEIAPKVAAAKTILDTWQSQNPERAERKLHLILWTPKDREPAPQYRERLTAIMNDIQQFYANEMNRIGFGALTIKLDKKVDQLLNIHVVRGRKPYSAYQGSSGAEIRIECLPTLTAAGIHADKETIVIFCNMANWDPEKRTITQNSPYYAGGSHRTGTAWQVDSPILNIDFLAEKGQSVRDGQYGNISLGRYNSIFIGGVCHELGHALSLPHNRERDDEREAFGTALMGSGNRSYGEELRGESKGSFLTLAHALRLASHPMFSGSIKGMNLPPSAKPIEISFRKKDKGFEMSGKVTADPPVYAVLGYMDPNGGGDYDATTTTAIPDKEGRFTLDCQALQKGKSAQLRVFYLQANGVTSGWLSSTPYQYPYIVDALGEVDISLLHQTMLLKPLLAALEKKDMKAYDTIAQGDAFRKEETCVAIASLLRSADASPLMAPATIDPSFVSVPLSDLACEKESVGYGAPLRNRAPAPQYLLQAGGKIYRHGLYAHAPSELCWQLDGSWNSLAGSCGSTSGQSTEMEFRIVGDGKVLWDSGIVKDGAVKPFFVTISGIKELKLITGHGRDDKTSDWSTWLEPVLTRSKK